MMKILHATSLYLLITGLTFASGGLIASGSNFSLCISVPPGGLEFGMPVLLSVDYFDSKLNLTMTYGI